MSGSVKRAGVAALASLGVLVAIGSLGQASDHLDGPRVTADPQADITDVFAFTSPDDPGRVVFIMTVAPFASRLSRFSAGVDYAFRVRRVTATQPLTLDSTPLDVTCTFAGADGSDGAAGGGPQTVTCNGPGGLRASATADDTGALGALPAPPAGGMRVFAGRRADPAFFDRQGALATLARGRASFTGQNAFEGANVLAIVVEIDSSAFAADMTSRPTLAVAAETVRTAR
jgi:Domain of unknown function (DUF4331)